MRHETGTTHRPPPEAFTPLLQITEGCSYNRCAFCAMYRDVTFRVSPESEIIEDLRELAPSMDRIERLFLLHGDPFALSARRLLRAAELVHEYLPKAHTLTCYCSVRSLRNKSPEELSALRDAGYNQLYVGLETGDAAALDRMEKGYTLADAEDALLALRRAGMDYHALLMSGAGGRGGARTAAAATAELLNRYPPKMVLLHATTVFPNTPLAAMRDRGDYAPPTLREHLEEEIALLQALEMDGDCFFFGSHVSNRIPVSANFSQKEQVVRHLEDEMTKLSPAELDAVWDSGML